MERSGFPETPILLGFGKSYLIPETTNFDIGEGIAITTGIVYNKGTITTRIVYNKGFFQTSKKSDFFKKSDFWISGFF